MQSRQVMWNLHDRRHFTSRNYFQQHPMNSETLRFKNDFPSSSRPSKPSYGQVLASFQEQNITRKNTFANPKYNFENLTPFPPSSGLYKSFGQNRRIFEQVKAETFVEKQKGDILQPRYNLRKRCFSEELIAENHVDRSRKSSSSALTDNLVEAKRIKTNYWDHNVWKKNVTPNFFNMDLEENNEVKDMSITGLCKLGKNMKQDKWYIVADSEILWLHFDFLNSYVQTDSKCVLLIPSMICKEIEDLCVGESTKKPHMMNARTLARKINCGAPYITVQSCLGIGKGSSPELESIIKCCLQAQDEQYHVVLISNNEDTHFKAQANGLYCFKLKEIKDGVKTEPSFDLQKMQNSQKFLNKYFPPNNNIQVNCAQNKLFNTNNVLDIGLNDHNKIMSSIAVKIRKLNFKGAEARRAELLKHKDIFFNKKSQCTNSLEKHLKNFCKEFKVNEKNYAVRVEEFVCFFTQIMEQSLGELLQENQASNPTNIMPPYTLLEAAECIKKLYGNNSTLKLLVEKFHCMLLKCYCNDCSLKPQTKPCDFMMLLGCSIFLIKCLEIILSSPPYLVDAGDRLVMLAKELCLSYLPDLPLPLVISSTTEPNHTDITPSEKRTIFVKRPSEVILYLKKHFPDWEQYNETHEEVLNEKVPEEKSPIINSNTIRLNDSGTKDANENIVTEKLTGAKLLRHLALNSGGPKKKLFVNLDKREKCNKIMTNMLNEILGNK